MIKSFISKKGFTLAEVLITLGIIGVVAAMTLPTLLTNTQKTALAVATKRFHSIVSNAVQLYMADENTDDLRNSELCARDDGSNWVETQAATDNFVRKYFNVVQECDSNNADKCFAANYRNYKANGQTYPSKWLVSGKAFILADGTVLTIQAGGQQLPPVTVYVDVNGRKGPNVMGYDLWSMSIFYDGTVDESGATPEARKAGTASEYREARFRDSCQNNYGGCFGHFLNNGYKFDY